MEEGMDTEEVLAKHRKALAEFAERNNIHIIETYYEVVSGESLYARPEMLRLLRTWRTAAMMPSSAWIWIGCLAAGCGTRA